MRNHETRSTVTMGLVLTFASALAVATSTAAFRDSYSRPDGAPPADSLGTTEASPGWSALDYREAETSAGFPVLFDVARVAAGRLVVAGRAGTTHPAFAIVDSAAENPSLEVEARFLMDDLNPALVANSMAIFLRGNGQAADGTINVPGLVLLDLQSDGFYFVRGVVQEGRDPVIFATGFLSRQSFLAADLDGDSRLESGEPFRIGLHLDGAWLTFSFNGVPQVANLYLANVPVPPGVGGDILLGRNRVSSARPFWTAVAFDDLREGHVADQDEDGSPADQDCNDEDPEVHPGAAERCNGVDDDCDGVVPPSEFDADGDGMSHCEGDCDDVDPRRRLGYPERCNGLDDDCDGVVPANEADADGDRSFVCDGDCDDSDPAAHPGAPERCNGLDDDCDAVIPAREADADGDERRVCEGDCDDSDPAVRPGAPERCNGADDDCDGAVPAREADADGDGSRLCDGDCNDADRSTRPGAAEACNGRDDDCDGVVPANESDTDGDGARACAGDCDDTDASVHPGAREACNGRDDDCDGVLQDKELDVDGDGSRRCSGDCNDADPTVHPGASEACNGRDDDCDGVVPASEADADGDGTRGCGGDCDDTNPRVGPRAVDLPGNEADENCDGLVVCDPNAAWRNHAEYLDCVTQSLAELRAAGRITAEEARRVRDAAAQRDVCRGRGHGDNRSDRGRNDDGRRGNDRDRDGRSDGHHGNGRDGRSDDRSGDSRDRGNDRNGNGNRGGNGRHR